MNNLTTNVSDLLIVSRHPAAIQFIKEELRSRGFDDALVPVVGQATESDVLGKHVVGNLPMNLASHAMAITAIEFKTPTRPRVHPRGHASSRSTPRHLRGGQREAPDLT